MNRIRSSRSLERECGWNVELMWLLRGLSPDHNTITDHPKSIKRVFRTTVSTAKGLDLIGGVLFAGDGTKLRAQNSKKNNYNEKKIARHLAYIDGGLEEYSASLSEADGDSEVARKLGEKVAKHQGRREEYEGFRAELERTGEKQVSSRTEEVSKGR